MPRITVAISSRSPGSPACPLELEECVLERLEHPERLVQIEDQARWDRILPGFVDHRTAIRRLIIG
jgi:hypothetical protein